VISSTNNATIRRVRRLRKRAEREKRKAFIVEGHRAVRVAVESRRDVEVLLHTPAAATRHRQLLVDAADGGARVMEAAPAVMAVLSAAATTPDVIAVVGLPEPVVAGDGPVLILSGVRDPATVGSLLATAAAAGIRRAVSIRGTADLFASTPVRVGAGAHFLIGLSEAPSLEESLASAAGARVVAIAPEGPPPWAIDLTGMVAFVVGDEQPANWDAAVSLPAGIGGAAAPLAVKAAVILFEARRQREAG
jgi:TrmH family RNA methyltransferase